MSDTIKEGLLRDNSNNIVYPKTKVSQVEGLSDYLVTANPTGATSASLTKLKIGNTNYVIDVGDHVQANKEDTEITDSLKTLRINGTQYNFSIEGVEGLMEYLAQFNTMIEKAANAATPITFDCTNSAEAATTFIYEEDSLEDGQYESALKGFYAKILDATDEYHVALVATPYMTPVYREHVNPEGAEAYEHLEYSGKKGDYAYTADVKIKDITIGDADETVGGAGQDNEILGKSIEITIAQSAAPTPTTYDNAEDASF